MNRTPKLVSNKYLGLLIMIVLLSFTGCSLPVSTGSATAEPQSNPEITTEPGSQIQFFLTADHLPVKVNRADGSTQDLKEGEATPISINDAIEVGQAGLGKLLYSDRIVIEIFQNTKLALAKINQVTGNRIEATFLLDAGHVHIRTGENGKADVILKTNDSTITTLVDDTDFTVCYAPGPDGLTCHPVISGSIKVFGKTGSQVYDGPSGGYTFNGQSPQAPVCFHEQEYDDWIDQMRNGEDVPALGALVADWYKSPCPETAQTAATETSQPAPAETQTSPETSTPPPTSPTVTINQQAFCRYGPNKAYLIASDLYPGDTGAVTGHYLLNLSKWLYVKFDKLSYSCWVAPSVVDVVGDINTVRQINDIVLPGPSSSYAPPNNVTAERNGENVTIHWQIVPMSDQDDRGYFLDMYVCQGGFYLWYPVSLNSKEKNSYTVKDEKGCPVPSEGKLYAVEVHGYTRPVDIKWPQP